MNENLSFDLDDMTIGEMVLFEESTGRTFSDMANMNAKDLQALALIVLRREDPEATMDDAGAIKISALMGGEEPSEDPPT